MSGAPLSGIGEKCEDPENHKNGRKENVSRIQAEEERGLCLFLHWIIGILKSQPDYSATTDFLINNVRKLMQAHRLPEIQMNASHDTAAAINYGILLGLLDRRLDVVSLPLRKDLLKREKS